MPWISDVVPEEGISSSQYGNPIRDRVVHQFTGITDRNTSTVPQEGMMCWTAAELTLWLYTGGSWRIMREPWANQALTSMGVAAGGTTRSPRSGAVQYRRFDVDQAEWRCRVLMDAASTGGDPTVVIFPGFNFDTGPTGILGPTNVLDAVTGARLGIHAYNPAGSVQSGFYITVPNGGALSVGNTDVINQWSGGANSILSAVLRVGYV